MYIKSIEMSKISYDGTPNMYKIFINPLLTGRYLKYRRTNERVYRIKAKVSREKNK